MPRISGVDIPNDKHTVISLQYIYGVGAQTARDLCTKARVEPRTPAKELTEELSYCCV